MKIFQLVTKPQRRGAEVFACQLNEWLESEGHQVLTLYLYHFLAPNSLTPSTPNVNAFAEQRSRLEKIPGFNPLVLWFVYRSISLFQPDIVQVNGGRALKYGVLARAIFGKRSFGLLYRSIGSPNFWSKGRLGKLLTDRSVRKADAVVAVSDATLAEFGSTPAGQIRRRIHRGSDLKSLRAAPPVQRTELETPKESKVLIYVGSLSFEKCPQRCVEVLASLVHLGHDTYLWMLGDGPEADACRELSAQLKVADRVRFLGTVQDVGPYLKAADLHLLTSDTEGLPGCLVESAALGVPCVAADVGGVKEIVRDGETGFVVPAGDMKSYVKHAARLLTDRDLYDQFAAEASEWADSFSLDRIGPQYLRLYHDIRGFV